MNAEALCVCMCWQQRMLAMRWQRRRRRPINKHRHSIWDKCDASITYYYYKFIMKIRSNIYIARAVYLWVSRRLLLLLLLHSIYSYLLLFFHWNPINIRLQRTALFVRDSSFRRIRVKALKWMRQKFVQFALMRKYWNVIHGKRAECFVRFVSCFVSFCITSWLWLYEVRAYHRRCNTTFRQGFYWSRMNGGATTVAVAWEIVAKDHKMKIRMTENENDDWLSLSLFVCSSSWFFQTGTKWHS